jgi:Domain of unknown function (DUF4919)
MITNRLFITLTFLVLSQLSQAQDSGEIILPAWNDKYSEFVHQLEAGNTKIDYREFRYSFLESKQFQIKAEKRTQYDSLKMAMIAQSGASHYSEVIRLSKAMLSIDYTSQVAHKYLQQTYKIIGDTAKRNKYHDIEFGLIHSIALNGNSQSFATSWEVVQVEEEYFALAMLGVTLKKQSIEKSANKICDKMEVVDEDGKDEVYYFDVTKLLQRLASINAAQGSK